MYKNVYIRDNKIKDLDLNLFRINIDSALLVVVIPNRNTPSIASSDFIVIASDLSFSWYTHNN